MNASARKSRVSCSEIMMAEIIVQKQGLPRILWILVILFLDEWNRFRSNVRYSFDGDFFHYIHQQSKIFSQISQENNNFMIYCSLQSRVLFRNFRFPLLFLVVFTFAVSLLPANTLPFIFTLMHETNHVRRKNFNGSLSARRTLSFRKKYFCAVDIGTKWKGIFRGWHGLVSNRATETIVFVCSVHVEQHTEIIENFDLWIILVKEQCR